jgi:hypothetical protein
MTSWCCTTAMTRPVRSVPGCSRRMAARAAALGADRLRFHFRASAATGT